MVFFKVYIIGFLVTLLIELLIEHFYYGNSRAETVTIKDILEDLCIALFSWLGIIAVIIWLWGEWKTDFQMKGYGKFLYDYENSLRRESEDAEEKE